MVAVVGVAFSGQGKGLLLFLFCGHQQMAYFAHHFHLHFLALEKSKPLQ